MTKDKNEFSLIHHKFSGAFALAVLNLPKKPILKAGELVDILVDIYWSHTTVSSSVNISWIHSRKWLFILTEMEEKTINHLPGFQCLQFEPQSCHSLPVLDARSSPSQENSKRFPYSLKMEQNSCKVFLSRGIPISRCNRKFLWVERLCGVYSIWSSILKSHSRKYSNAQNYEKSIISEDIWNFNLATNRILNLHRWDYKFTRNARKLNTTWL